MSCYGTLMVDSMRSIHRNELRRLRELRFGLSCLLFVSCICLVGSVVLLVVLLV